MFFTFNQNNSGGRFTLDERAGITHYVVVEAPTASRAKKIAEDIGLYWNGCAKGYDCDCCGDRWSDWMDDDDGTEVPMVYDKPVAEHGKDWMPAGREIAVHYADGRIEWFQLGKRSDFERNPRDFYVTPKEAIIPLLPYLPQTEFTFCEPCAGNGALIGHLEELSEGLCYRASDIEPQGYGIRRSDVFQITKSYDDYYITNPPWDRKILHPLITHLSDLAPTWLLFDADWMHTKQSVPFLPRLRSVVSVGRLKWIPDSKMTGKDNCAWYLFDKPVTLNTTYFYGRT